MTRSENQDKAPMRKLLFPTLATAVALAILFNLGFWQLDRLAWKEKLIEQVEAGVSAAPVDAPGPVAWSGMALEDDYRHVALSGRFLDGAVYYYTALNKPVGAIGGPGRLVYAPFETEDGWVVLINRGFIPQDLDPAAGQRLAKSPVGTLRLTGLLRLSEKPNWTTPAPSEGLWFARDTQAMGEVLDIAPEKLAPYSVDLDVEFTPASGLPQAGETIVQFKNDHLGYALTWFGLAATLIGVYLTYSASVLWPRRRAQ
ncbi:SURF1 family protein [Labrenzia sp. VG12]|uniref:SURF1 family protein n=1 Tax=Labrenzia sp. VG12 TaxID=2021862 RepID=UPI001AD8D14F|nr:SURF1 family cytochrome oxidase biogenesis protein [Labrenzia sp. VG12]